MFVSRVFPKKTHTVVCKSFVETLKLKFPATSCSIKTDLVLLCTHPQGILMKHRGCANITIDYIYIRQGI